MTFWYLYFRKLLLPSCHSVQSLAQHQGFWFHTLLSCSCAHSEFWSSCQHNYNFLCNTYITPTPSAPWPITLTHSLVHRIYQLDIISKDVSSNDCPLVSCDVMPKNHRNTQWGTIHCRICYNIELMLAAAVSLCRKCTQAKNGIWTVNRLSWTVISARMDGTALHCNGKSWWPSKDLLGGEGHCFAWHVRVPFWVITYAIATYATLNA